MIIGFENHSKVLSEVEQKEVLQIILEFFDSLKNDEYVKAPQVQQYINQKCIEKGCVVRLEGVDHEVVEVVLMQKSKDELIHFINFDLFDLTKRVQENENAEINLLFLYLEDQPRVFLNLVNYYINKR